MRKSFTAFYQKYKLKSYFIRWKVFLTKFYMHYKVSDLFWIMPDKKEWSWLEKEYSLDIQVDKKYFPSR